MTKDIYQTLIHEWLEKTEWVQETAQPSELGLHRGDVILNRFRELERQRDQLLEVLKEIYDWTAHKNTVWATKASAAIAKAEGEKT